MKSRSKRFVPQGTRKALAEIKKLAKHHHDYHPSLEEVVCTWAAWEMSQYLKDFLEQRHETPDRHAFVKWLRNEPSRIERIMKLAAEKFEGSGGTAAALFQQE
jgi:hypothetical protein